MSTYKKTPILTEEKQKFLQTLIEHGIIPTTAVGYIDEMTKKEQKRIIIEKLGHEPKIYTRNNGRVLVKIKVNEEWKQITGSNENDLYDNLYNFLFGDINITLEEVYPRFMLYRRNMAKVTDKTIRENANDWKAFLQDNPIIKIPIRNLKTKDFLHFFEEITKSRTLTSKRVSNVKSLLNKIYAYCIREELVEYNPIASIDFTEFNYFVPDNSNEVYPIEDRNKLLNYLYDVKEPYALAIQLAFQVTCRIGEITALCWEDINFDTRTISVTKQATRHSTLNDDLTFSANTVEIVPRIKGNTDRGKRILPMTQEAMRILRSAKEINPDGKFVFMPFGRVMLTDTFNEYLKRYCRCADIPYHSSHKIRFTTCSLLYRSTNDLAEVSKVMGHSQTATTLHYLRNVSNDSNVLDDMELAFAPTRTKDQN